MPELPDVEAFRLSLLAGGLVGRRIVGVDPLWPRALLFPSPDAFLRDLRGRAIVGIERRAKFLLFPLDRAGWSFTSG